MGRLVTLDTQQAEISACAELEFSFLFSPGPWSMGWDDGAAHVLAVSAFLRLSSLETLLEVVAKAQLLDDSASYQVDSHYKINCQNRCLR